MIHSLPRLLDGLKNLKEQASDDAKANKTLGVFCDNYGFPEIGTEFHKITALYKEIEDKYNSIETKILELTTKSISNPKT